MSIKYATGGVRINTSTYAGRGFSGDTFDITLSSLITLSGNAWYTMSFVVTYSSIGGGAESPTNTSSLIRVAGVSAWNSIAVEDMSNGGHDTSAAIASSSTTGAVVRISGLAANSTGHYQIQTIGPENTAVSLGA
jgi:hypothetical protein